MFLGVLGMNTKIGGPGTLTEKLTTFGHARFKRIVYISININQKGLSLLQSPRSPSVWVTLSTAFFFCQSVTHFILRIPSVPVTAKGTIPGIVRDLKTLTH